MVLLASAAAVASLGTIAAFGYQTHFGQRVYNGLIARVEGPNKGQSQICGPYGSGPSGYDAKPAARRHHLPEERIIHQA